MHIPEHLEALVHALAHRNWNDQLAQMQRMAPDHPQRRVAIHHLEQARQLLELTRPHAHAA